MSGIRMFGSGARCADAADPDRSSRRWRRLLLGLLLAAAVVPLAPGARAMNVVAAPVTPAMTAAVAAPIRFRFAPSPRVVPSLADLTPDYSANPMSRAGPEVRWRGRLGPTSRVARDNFANSPFMRHLLEVLFVGS